MDVRLNNVSQLAGFTKRNDLAYFVSTICGAEYVHELLLAPTSELLDSYKGGQISWKEYEEAFRNLIEYRDVEHRLDAETFRDKRTVLLCSEPTPERCHRRVAVEYLASKWEGVKHIAL
jgi:uncharacterized protein (DUF488 family)